MPEPSSQIDEPQAKPDEVIAPRPGRWQVGLRTLVLLMAVIAVGMTVFVNRREIDRLERRNRPMRPLVRELKVDNPAKIAVVKLEELWMDDNRWDLSLPPGDYRICVATRDVPDSGLAPVTKSAMIQGGRHRLSLAFRREPERCPIVVRVDGAEILAFDETKEWGSSGSSTDWNDFATSTQVEPNRPLILFRRQYRNGNVQISRLVNVQLLPPEGLLFWIEPVESPKPKP
jgi:hypothetical protein